ncbi:MULTISPECIES: alpha-L-fucosidase [unclassified Lentimonas]|uniref:alpha-L-fucosidase n=1 Tax=unclassified Lentimonas TaxID=2630993 RepID=UPI00132555C6|nr:MULTISPECIES: alpha-L-fucosidase [unclassified Lentimonas]CAA6691709.1 Alpha-L-fucosidase (EC [Lentimonas sp. CC19]CAA6696051.1 Alpha-L-fucosidase (EC [Lentimonas sp. CC10]CAA7070063.1 Alpha-L-fucosidase (EC [Lentimonas sp. CC11]
MKIRNKALIGLLALLTLSPAVVFSETEKEKDDSRMEWWRDARYGMFIHWGLYSVAGGEWKGKDYGKEAGGPSAEWLMTTAGITPQEYRDTLAPQFNPTEFDAVKWVSVAKDAGMKYMVITAKHHDGFCLFDTDATDYNIMDASPFKRDIIKELADECKKQGLRFGVYYSQYQDWYHRAPNEHRAVIDYEGMISDEEYLKMVETNLKELLTNYGDMAVMWFDTGGMNVEEADSQGAVVRELQPKTVICSRLYSNKVKGKKYADFNSLGDRKLPTSRMNVDAETCMTMRKNWGFDRDDDNWKTQKDIIEFLAVCASRGVNLLLNVGPSPEGTFMPEEIERLKAVGEWLRVNGDSIYGTQSSPLNYDFTWGGMTQKDQSLYLHVMKWQPGSIEFNGIVGKPSKAYFMADSERSELSVSYTEVNHITKIEMPADVVDPNNSVIVLEYEKSIVTDPKAKGKYHWYNKREHQ